MPLLRYIGVATAIVVNNSLRGQLGVAAFVTAVFGLVGYWAGSEWLLEASEDLTVLLGLFFVPPVCALISGLAVGIRMKKRAVTYDAPKWDYTPIAYETSELKEILSVYGREYFRVVTTSNLLHFFTPVVLIVGVASAPYYAEYIAIPMDIVWALFTALANIAVFCISCYAGFASSKNRASDDFTPRLVRESTWLAEFSKKIPGVSESRIVLDAAANGPIRILRSPRVLLRITGLKETSFIYCWSNELRAMGRVQCSLAMPGGSVRVRWTWSNEDPYFVKHVEGGGDSYYVKFPLPPAHGSVDVKDINLILSNAVAIVCLEWLAAGGEKQSVESTLRALGLATP